MDWICGKVLHIRRSVSQLTPEHSDTEYIKHKKNSSIESKNWLFVCKLQQRHYGGLVINSELSLQQTKIIST